MSVCKPEEAVNGNAAHKEHQECIARTDTRILFRIKTGHLTKELEYPNDGNDSKSNTTKQQLRNKSHDSLLVDSVCHSVVCSCHSDPHYKCVNTASDYVQNEPFNAGYTFVHDKALL